MKTGTRAIKLSVLEEIKSKAKAEIEQILLKYSKMIPGFTENSIAICIGDLTIVYDKEKYIIELPPIPAWCVSPIRRPNLKNIINFAWDPALFRPVKFHHIKEIREKNPPTPRWTLGTPEDMIDHLSLKLKEFYVSHKKMAIDPDVVHGYTTTKPYLGWHVIRY